MAVVVVRRAVHFEGLREVGDLLRLVKSIPDHVDRCDVHRAGFEEGPEAAIRVQVFAGADRDRGAVAYGGEGDRVERIDFEPHQVVILQRARDAQHAFGGEVEVEVDDRLGLPLRTFGERVEQLHQRVFQLG